MRSHALWGALLGAIAVSVSGCDGADLQAYCDEVSSCENLNEKDTEACVVAQEAAQSIDSEYGCRDEHTLYYDCLLEKGSCQAELSGVPCQTSEDCSGGQCTTNNVCELKRFTTGPDDCKAEREAYRNCSFD